MPPEFTSERRSTTTDDLYRLSTDRSAILCDDPGGTGVFPVSRSDGQIDEVKAAIAAAQAHTGNGLVSASLIDNNGVSFGTMAQQPHVPGTAKTYRFSKSSSEFFTCDDLDAFADALDHLDGAADAAGIADDGTV
tara:strand:+ start:475 stop:879 length:405 start_codon:yes stop_codon:yes gene_type:complete